MTGLAVTRKGWDIRAKSGTVAAKPRHAVSQKETDVVCQPLAEVRGGAILWSHGWPAAIVFGRYYIMNKTYT